MDRLFAIMKGALRITEKRHLHTHENALKIFITYILKPTSLFLPLGYFHNKDSHLVQQENAHWPEWPGKVTTRTFPSIA